MSQAIHGVTLAVLALGLLPACSGDLSGPTQLDDASLLKRGGDTRQVEPCNGRSGCSDARNIERALERVRAGGEVRLGPGDFWLDRAVEVSAFDGSMSGSGREATRVHGLGTQEAPFQTTVIPQTLAWQGEWAALFIFDKPGTRVSITEMSMDINDDFNAAGGMEANNALVSFIFVALGDADTSTYLSDLELTGNVRAETAPFSGGAFNGILISGAGSWEAGFSSPTSGGQHVIESSQVSGFHLHAYNLGGFRGAEVKVQNNSFFDQRQINLRWLADSTVLVENNDIENWSFGSLVITHESVPVFGGDTEVVIRDNRLTMLGLFGIEVGPVAQVEGDPSGQDLARYLMEIEDNRIFMGPDPTGFDLPQIAAIQLGSQQNGAEVRCNTFEGRSFFGVELRGSSDTLLEYNDTSGLQADQADYAFLEGNGLCSDDNSLRKSTQASVLDECSRNTVVSNNRKRCRR